MNRNLETECLFCKQEYGLTCELIESIEDMFFNYIKETGESVLAFNFNKWLIHFRKHATFRTVCFECYEQMGIEYKQELKRKRVEEEIRERNARDIAELENLPEEERNKWLKHVASRSAGAKRVIKWWLLKAKLRIMERQNEK